LWILNVVTVKAALLLKTLYSELMRKTYKRYPVYSVSFLTIFAIEQYGEV